MPSRLRRRNALHLRPVRTWRCAKHYRNPNGFYVGEFSVESRHWYHLIPVEAITDASPGSFVGWCEQHNHCCFIGEFGVPRQDACYMTTLEGALAYMRENGISGTYCAVGPWWGDYNLTIEPADLSNPVARPQMDVLARYSAEEQNGIIPLLDVCCVD